MELVKKIIHDKTIFIMSCINESIGDERLKWSGASKDSNACEGDWWEGFNPQNPNATHSLEQQLSCTTIGSRLFYPKP